MEARPDSYAFVLVIAFMTAGGATFAALMVLLGREWVWTRREEALRYQHRMELNSLNTKLSQLELRILQLEGQVKAYADALARASGRGGVVVEAGEVTFGGDMAGGDVLKAS